MLFTIGNICKKFKIPKQELRDFYYARIRREEQERRERVRAELEKDDAYRRLQEDYLKNRLASFAQSRPFLLVCSFAEKQRYLLRHGFFPWEDDELFHCPRCLEKGIYHRDGKKLLCSCWKKGIKKALLPYRRAIENIDADDMKYLTQILNNQDDEGQPRWHFDVFTKEEVWNSK